MIEAVDAYGLVAAAVMFQVGNSVAFKAGLPRRHKTCAGRLHISAYFCIENLFPGASINNSASIFVMITTPFMY
jgi:hypothetical protein